MKKCIRTSFICFFLLTGVTACSTGNKKISSRELSNEFVFPFGIYQQDVELEIPNGKYHFKGVVQLRPDHIQIVALSPFGTTVFKITDDRIAGKVTDEIYVERMKPFEAKLLTYYSNLKALLTSKKLAVGELKTLSVDEQTTIVFEAYDQNRIPESVSIDSRNFKVRIKVTSYDL